MEANLSPQIEILESRIRELEAEVAEQKRIAAELRFSEAEVRTLLEVSPVCNKIIDLESRLQYMSTAGQKQLKIDDITPYYGGSYPPEIYPEPMRAPLIEHLEKAKVGETSSVECPVHDVEGNEVWFRTTFVPVRDEEGRIRHVIGTSMDITECKRIERAMRKAKEEAEVANRAKSEFLANMSHEIRTPLTAILGFTDVLLESLQDSEHLEIARTVRKNGDYLVDLVDDVLDLSKIEARKCVVERIECSPRQIVEDVASMVRPRATAKDLPLEVRFEGPIPATIQSDPTRLRQILINIIDNAIKFTETGSVEIVTQLVDPVGEQPQLRFDVIDTGIGIADDCTEKVFRPFAQADSSTTRRFGGTGLGLTISKRLTELLGGEVSISSTLGQGSTFSFAVSTGCLDDVPMISNADEASGLPSPPEGAKPRENLLGGYRVLLVEDGPDNQRLISLMLKKAGAEVTLANNGQVALELGLTAHREGNPFDVILMDMQMPVLDGYEATGQLRSQGYMAPIIALTAHVMSTDRQKCLDAGCDAHAGKPIDREKLISLVSRYATSVTR